MSSAEASLAGRLFSRLGARLPDANLAFSPTSIRVAMVMAYVGARGVTAEEIRETLGFGSPDAEVLATRAALHALRARERLALRLANRFFVERTYRLAAGYVSALRDGLDAEPEALDFVSAAEVSRAHINAWVEEQTEERIRDLLATDTVSAVTRLVLANAVYFKAAWADPFLERRTAPGTFFGARETTAQFMQKGGSLPYSETDEAQLVALPYEAPELAMVVLLPKPHVSLGAFETPGVEMLLRAGLALPDSRTVDVQLPRFEVTSSFRLEEELEAMGIRTAFRYPEADFSGMDGTRELFLGTAVHKAFVKVDEKGTEAAAATAVGFPLGGPPPKPVRFRAERPFLFAIVARTTKSVLFLGRVTAPNGS
jgi:serpin B